MTALQRFLVSTTCAALLLSACTHAEPSISRQAETKPTQSPPSTSNALDESGPVLRVIDTDFSKGRLELEHTITLQDVEKFHGHLCDGVVVGFIALTEAFKRLYPEGVVDRTNTRIVSGGSPCISDTASYLSGGRYQFNTFYVSKDVPGLYVVQRIDTGEAVSVSLNPGVKPLQISEMGSKAVKRELDACELDTLKHLEDAFAAQLIAANPEEVFTVTPVPDFQWAPTLINDVVKTDVLNNDAPHCR